MKRPFVVGLILCILGLFSTTVNASLGAVLFLCGLVVLFVGWRKRRAQKKAQHQSEAAPQQDVGQTNIETHKVAGTSFRREAIESIGTPNSDYDMTASEAIESYDYGDKIYEYDFCARPALVPEPNNPHDPNAIRVEADGVHIGYIKAGSTAHVRKLMNEDRIKSMDIEIGGGRYKQLEENDNDRPTLSKDRTEYWARLTLHLK